MKYTMMIFATLATLTFVKGAAANASPAKATSVGQTHLVHKYHPNDQIEVWCGARDSVEKARFPYLTAVRNVNRQGMHYQVATLYKKGRPVLRQYVFKSRKNNQTVYESSGDGFSLTLNDNGHLNTEGGLKAVVEDHRDGTTFVSNGAMPCFRTGKS